MFKPLRFAVLLAGATLAVSAWAQPAPQDDYDQAGDQQAAPDADPPTRVARLAYLNGDVSFVPAGENDWVEAQLNRPLITGDKLWTDRGSRAELNLGEASLRIDQNTSFDFLNLNDGTAQVELTQGSLNLHVRRLYDNQSYEVDTPTLAFVITRVGDYRVDVLPNGQSTVVTVQQGSGDAYGEGGARFRIEEGQSVTFNDAQLRDYESADVPRPDDFDNFVEQRDHRWENSSARRYVSEEVIGYEDLDDNGEWSDVPEYGSVWYPTTVEVGWAPYHHGHWGWVGAYGWTWIDDAPWGFAPFHYGRWAYIGNRWGWCPGPRAERAVYAPALVAFVGGGVGVSISTGPVGWFPLGPRDVYFPSYRVSERYFARLNVSNAHGFTSVTINNYYGGYRSGHIDYERINYTNRHVNGAIVAVPREAFISARPVARAAIAVDRETFAAARVSAVAAVAPTRASLVATERVARAAPPPAVVNRQIVAASKPPAVVPFAQRQAALERNPGRPLPVTELHRPVVAAGAAGPRGGAPVAAGNPNVRVVTSGGAPVRTAAPVLPARSVGGAPNGAPNAGAANPRGGRETLPGNRNLPAVQNPANNRAVENGAVVNGAGRPAVQGNRNLPAVQNPNEGGNGRAVGAQHLDSSRFAHPQNGQQNGAQNGNAAVGPRAGVTPQGQQPARGVNPRYTPAERAHENAQATGGTNPAVNAQNAAHPNVEPRGRDIRNGASGNPNAYTRETGSGRPAGGQAIGGQGRPEYHAPVQQQQRVEPAHVQTPPPAQQQYRTESHREQQPQYHAPQNPVQQQQYHPQPQPQAHTPPPQPQVHSPPPQQQYRAPATNSGQMQNQQIQRQPPPQAQPQPREHGQAQGREKKDDDKRH